MLEIINNEAITLELDGDARIVVERTNPLLSDSDSFFQDITYPGTAPLTATNKRFIAGGHLVEVENTVYELPVIVYHVGTLLFSGLLRYKIRESRIDFILHVNWGEVAGIAKAALLTDIDFGDAYYMPNQLQAPIFAEDTLRNPQDYGYAWIPIQQHDFPYGTSTERSDFFVNNWQYDQQAFKPFDGTPTPDNVWRWAPHFKLSYVLRKVLKYLGYDATGSFWDSERGQKLYIHSECAVGDFLQPANSYLPAISVADFVQQIRQRLRLGIYFDRLSRTVAVDNLDTVLGTAADHLELSQFVSNIMEIATDEKKGYDVTLKPWPKDLLFNPSERDPSPAFRLIVGDGENKVEAGVSTLVTRQHPDLGYRYPATGTSRQELSDTGDDIFYPPPSELNQWPVRLIWFDGMREVEPSKFWPEAMAYDLDQDDVTWYRYINDSKVIRAVAHVPQHILPELQSVRKIGLISEQGTHFEVLPVQINYQLATERTELTTVEILARTMVSGYRTSYNIIPLTPTPAAEGHWIAAVKFIFDEQLGKIDLTASVYRSGDPLFPDIPETPATVIGEIESSADDYHVGGSLANIYYEGQWMWQLILRIPSSLPQPQPPYCAGRTYSHWVLDGQFWKTDISSARPRSGAPIVIRIT